MVQQPNGANGTAAKWRKWYSSQMVQSNCQHIAPSPLYYQCRQHRHQNLHQKHIRHLVSQQCWSVMAYDQHHLRSNFESLQLTNHLKTTKTMTMTMTMGYWSIINIMFNMRPTDCRIVLGPLSQLLTPAQNNGQHDGPFNGRYNGRYNGQYNGQYNVQYEAHWLWDCVGPTITTTDSHPKVHRPHSLFLQWRRTKWNKTEV